MTQEALPETPEPGQMVTAEGELEPAPAAPPPIEAPPEPESLAEQVYRESHTVPESTGPSDIVPNRPNIRAPEAVETEEEASVGVEAEAAAEEGDEEAEHESARELIAEAEAAETTDELDRIEGLAEGRVTVLNAVMERRSQLRGR